jgi:hypothetical protein
MSYLYTFDMKTFNEYLESIQRTQWTKPDIAEEREEIERTANVLNVDLNQLMKAVQSAQLVPLDDVTWSKMKNTDSWHNIVPGNIETVKTHAAKYGRDWLRLVQAFERGSPLPAPIVVIHEGNPYLIGGNTRLMVARALGARPSVLLAKMNDTNH